ncbi:hypothetical protein SKAU_G00343100 [Synaphobranchus kaupii]|uniref:Ig-like domain-containing protein n=1 Tax=Synaphobranchus kaupii TaxID=118154 RepID=A0A9Q1IH76_SYNKA|nr:hypothetical protein SKAU_G00343050 [Synaphobranchus kaupii]KAJ8339677.1 hypothetical protein SKAU_G00343100 [Synaphobranchus kaupii]
MPQRIEALAGSCVLIPCAFEVPEDQVAKLTKPAVGVWRKSSQFDGGVDVYDSSHRQNILQGEIIGDLMQKNCTSILDAIPRNYTDVYFFRIVTGFRCTFTEKVTINVIASPRKPQVTSMGMVMEGTPVNLICTVLAPCPRLPPALTWYPPELGRVENTLLRNPDGTRTASSTLSFVASHLHHGDIVCSAVHPLQQGGGSERAEEAVALNVLYSPKNTSASVSPSELVTAGTTVNLTCSSDGNPQVAHYSWFRVRGGEVTAVGWERTLTLNLTEGHVGLYHCQAQNEHGRQNSTAVQLHLQAGLIKTTLMSPQDQGEDDSPVYENISAATKLGFTANQSRKDLDEASVYSNIETLYKTGCLTNPPATTERNYQLYANSFIPSSR